MAGRYGRKRRNGKLLRLCRAMCALVLVVIVGVAGARFVEDRMSVQVENAGRQMTASVGQQSTEQVFADGRWHQRKNVETMLVIGIDDFGAVEDSGSYNNTNQADFLMLFVREKETGKSNVIHLNRDTMTDITVLGVTGKSAGTQRAQLALAYNYGQGRHDSSRNTVQAASNLLYGMEIDHYITVTMDAVPVLNDWVGGVTVEIMDDMTGVDDALVLGEKVALTGEQALAYVRTRKGLDDSTNINRMKRQRQYAAAWAEAAREKLKDSDAAAQLILQLSDCHYSDCTAQELAEFANGMGESVDTKIVELPGEAVQGERYAQFHVDEEGLRRLVLDTFYEPAEK